MIKTIFTWLLGCALAIPAIQAQTYYWVGGAGAWTDLNKWAACSGCAGGAFVQVPQSFNDVIIDNQSGFGALPAASRTLNITSGNTLVCRSLRVNTGGHNVILTGSTRLDIYGSMWLESGTVTTNWTGEIHLFGAQPTDSIVLATNVTLRNTLVQFEPTNTGQYTTVNYKQLGGGYAAHTLLTKGTGSNVLFLNGLITNYATINSGTAEARDTLAAMGANNIGLTINNAASFRCAGNSRLQFLSINNTGVADFSGNYRHRWIQLNANNNSTLNIQNAYVQHTATSFYSDWLSASTSNILAAGSMLECIGRAAFNANNRPYHRIIFRDNPWVQSGANVDTLIFTKGFFALNASTFNVGGGAVPGYLRMQGGALYNSGGGLSAAPSALATFNVLANTTTLLMGQCAQKLIMERIDFNFASGTGALLTADNLRLENVRALGVNAPYQAGSNSYAVPFSVNTGWNVGASPIGVPVGRYLRWVGPIPANVNDSTQYGSWNNPQNWADGNAFPNIVPGDVNLVGFCPPTLADSVVFPPNSYVRVDSPYIEAKSLFWLGSGAFADMSTNIADDGVMDIFGSIQWSSTMRQSFNGRTRFRAWESWHTIRSNGQSFWWRISFEGRTDSASWTLLDSLRVPEQPYVTNTYSVDFLRGRFITNNQQMRMETWRADGNSYRYLELGSSQIYITGLNNPWQGRWSSVTFGGNNSNTFVINAGTSHIHFTSMAAQSTAILPIFAIGGGHRLYDVTLYGFVPMLDRTSAGNLYIRRLIFQQSGWIRAQSTGTDSIRYLASNTVGIPNSNFLLQETNAAANMVVDSGYYFAAADIQRNIAYQTIMWLRPGSTYTISHPTNHTQTLLAPSGRLDATGNCENYINISGGNFFSTINQSVTYVNLTDNTASSALFSFSNSNTNGVTTGWTGVAGTPRVLYWYDALAGNSKRQWNSPGSWSLASGVMLDRNGGNDVNVGNCPPTRVDTVIFSTGSFSNPNDTVEINLGQTAAECADMRWLNNATVTPVFWGTYPQQLNIYASLEFSRTMQQRFIADINFIGAAGLRTIRSNGRVFQRKVTFNAPGGEWRLLDSMWVTGQYGRISAPWEPDGHFYLTQGTFNLNGQYAELGSFASIGSLPRQLILANSQLHIIGFYSNGHPSALFAYNMSGSNYGVSAANSTVTFRRVAWFNYAYANPYYPYMRMETGTGMQYDRLVWASNNLDAEFIGINTRVNYLETWRDGSLQGSNNRFLNIRSLNPTQTLTVTGSNHTVDSIFFAGNGTFLGSHRYRNYVGFSPNKVYQFQANSTQYLENACNFQAIGTGGGGEITFRSSLTNSQAYIRKDSARVCVDFIYMRDIWAIGNGVSTQTACATPTCDTALISSTTPNIYTSGRARFQAGANADNQGNNAGWDFSPYPPVPQLALLPQNRVLCPGDSLKAVFMLQGQTPMDVRYEFTVDGVSVFIDSFNIRPLSGTGTAADPYRWEVNIVPDSGKTTQLRAVEIAVDRCFNNKSTGAGLAVAVVSCLLPLDLLSWQVACADQKPEARWEVAQAREGDFYTVESSTDGIHFAPISEKLAGNRQTRFAQTLPAAPDTRYYRLRKDETYSGEVFYSPIAASQCGSAGFTEAWQVLPNPSNGEFIVRAPASNLGEADFQLIDAQGRLLRTGTLAASQSQHPFSLDLPEGMYLLRIQQGAQSSTHKILIRR